MSPLTLTIVTVLVGAVVQTVTQALVLGRLAGKFEARFEALTTEVAGIRGTLNNAMERLGSHGEEIAVLMDRARTLSGKRP